MAHEPSLDHLWLPFTPNRDFRQDPKSFLRAEGVYYEAVSGARVLDGCSGLFCVPLGHGRAEIADAVRAQLLELDFAGSFNRNHPKASELAGRVAALTPDGLDRVFFTNSGSESVDSAMKMALAYHRARGDGQRTMFVSRERAYHGVNMGGVALSGIKPNRAVYGPGVAGVVHMRHTAIPENRTALGQPEKGAELAQDLERACALYGGENIAAVFVEPIAGSTGCLAPPVGYLEALREICDAHGILLIFDEVITGIGRTGHAFAADAFGVTPDVITLAKALTNGMQPMGAVASSDAIYQTIVEQADGGLVEFFHGYTYSGHPAACAAGVASFDLYEREGSFARAHALSGPFLAGLAELRDVAGVADVRGFGLLGAVDIEPVPGEPGRAGYEVQKQLFDAGLHVKATGDALLLAPAFVFEETQLDEMFGVLRETLAARP
ncbi:MAG: aminotransferase class III-fold pyridoxal phosphate-dependent enzyme [Myxococcota bacterium]